MAFIRSQVFCVFVAVFVVLFCVDLAYRVEGDIIPRLANIGDDITLSCDRFDSFLTKWYRNGTLIANYHGVVINDPRFTQGANYNRYPLSNNIHISNISMSDSATFQCRNFYGKKIHSYDLRVIRCSNCIIHVAAQSYPDERKVICTLGDYWTSQVLYKYIILNDNTYHNAIIAGKTFDFWITVTELNRLPSEFYLQIEAETRITCMLPTQLSLPSFPTTSPPTTSLSLKQTMPNRPSTIYFTAHTLKDKTASSDKNTRGGNITLIIIIILGSVFILILIVIIVLRCKKTKDRRENKHIGNASIEKETVEVCYESVEDGSRERPEFATTIKELKESSLDQPNADHLENGEMIDNILYDSRHKIADSSISRMEGPLDNALYATPDKRATISRESKSTSK